MEDEKQEMSQDSLSTLSTLDASRMVQHVKSIQNPLYHCYCLVKTYVGKILGDIAVMISSF